MYVHLDTKVTWVMAIFPTIILPSQICSNITDPGHHYDNSSIKQQSMQQLLDYTITTNKISSNVFTYHRTHKKKKNFKQKNNGGFLPPILTEQATKGVDTPCCCADEEAIPAATMLTWGNREMWHFFIAGCSHLG